MAEIFAPFEVNGPFALDKRQVFETKAEMKAFDTKHLPDTYFAVCSEDRKMYVYNKDNSVSETTGKWRVVESGGSGDFSYTHAGASTVAVGGIAAGEVFNNTPLTDILDKMFFPYKTPTISKVTTSEAAGTYEPGKTVTVSKVAITYTQGSENITGIKITDNKGNVLYNGAVVTSGTEFNLTKSVTFTTDGSITVELIDGNQGKTSTVKYEFKNSVYWVTNTDGTTIPDNTDGSCTKGNSATITTQANGYIWFLSPVHSGAIYQYANNSWIKINAKDMGTVQFHTDAGKTVEYYAYRSDKMVANTNKYKFE